MMKRIIFIVLFLFSWVLSFEQTRPNTFTEETSPTNANFEVYSQKNNLPRRASLNNLKAFFDQYIYTKTDSICISRQAGDTCVYFVPTDIDSIGMSNDTIILYGGGDEIADLPVSRIEAIIEIGSGNITNGSVSTVDLADGSVNSAKIADGSVTTGDILDGTIATADLADALITLAKLAANSIDSTKVIDGGLSGADLADAAILTAKIADGQVTGDKIASNTIPLGDLTQISSNVLLGRYSSGIGDVQQISIGSGLTLTGSTLSATASGINTVDSINDTRSGDDVTISLYSGGSLVDATTFTDNTGGSYDDLDTVVTSADWAPVATFLDDYKYISVTAQSESGDASDAQFTLPSPGSTLAKIEIYVHAWDESGTYSPKIATSGSSLYYQSSTTNSLTLTDGHTYRVQAEQTTNGSWYWIVNDITEETSSSVDELNDLSDVNITSPAAGNILVYDSGDSRWENSAGYLKYGEVDVSYDGLIIRIRYLQPYNGSGISSGNMSGSAASGYTLTVPNGVKIRHLSLAGGTSNLNPSGDLDFTLIATWESSEVSELYTMPLLQSGFFISNWDTYGITGYFNNSTPGTVQYIFSNLGGFGGSGYRLYFNF